MSKTDASFPSMSTWFTRIEVVRDGRTFGWTNIGAVTTEVLPRVGEVVAFDGDLASERMRRLIALGPQDSPTVSRIEHLVGLPGETEVIVVIRANTAQYMNDALAKEFTRLEEGWMLNPAWANGS